MGSRRNLKDQKRSFKAVDEEEGDEEEEEKGEEEEESESKRIRAIGNTNSFSSSKKAGSSSGSNPGGWVSTARAVTCQADNCKADMTEAKRYHRRHKVCELHFKAPAVLIAGIHQRFCQQCSRFHDLLEFDEAKRSCRRRLAGHNERRRKSSYDFHGEGSN